MFTIFTPCYNGEKTIQRVFSSIELQTIKDFEWIIINDGSTDNSEIVIKDLISCSFIKDKILFISQDNKGKHISWNNAVKLAKGEWFLPCDCDDSFLPNTLEFFLSKLSEVTNRGGENIRN